MDANIAFFGGLVVGGALAFAACCLWSEVRDRRRRRWCPICGGKRDEVQR